MSARLSPHRTLVPALALLSYVLAFAQRPGEAFADTRVELSVDPALFLERVASVWSSTTDLGHVQSGQFVGYLFPMAPWFAFWDAVGLEPWVAQRLWLGTLLALAAWGAVRLMDALYSPSRGVAHVAAGLVFVLNPYVVVFASRGTVTLLTYAALPWLMLAAHRGLAEPRGWRWPALGALLLAASGGGVNAGVIGWALAGPLGLLVYEVAVLGRHRREAWSFVWRAGICCALASAWWAIPVLLQSGYGADFLRFTEQPGTIWRTTSLPEVLRLLGFWIVYSGVGFGQARPAMSIADTYLFDTAVVVASFLVPLVAFGGFVLARRWRYAPFFLLLAVGTLLVVFAGFPEGTPLRRALTFTYNHVAAVQFLRTTYKAAPLLALAMACLGGAVVAAALERARAATLRVGRRRVPAWALAPLAVLPFVFAIPLVRGEALDPSLTYGEVPRHWPRAIAAAERDLPAGRRIMVLPGEQFGFYRWGGTMDPVGPALTDRPLLVREVVPYADPRSSQLQEAVDDLVQQDRLVPGQLPPLLGLLGVGRVLLASDSDVRRSGALRPGGVAAALREQPGLSRPLASFGRSARRRPPAGRSGPDTRTSDLALFAAPRAGEGIVRARPAQRPLLLDGDAQGITELAAHGALGTDSELQYAADAEDPRGLAERGARIVFTDSNRRRVVNASRLRERYGPTLGAEDPISPDSPTFELFPGAGDERRTVARYRGVRFVRAPLSPAFALFPESRPFAALDGRAETSWLADENLDEAQRYLQLELERPRRVRELRLLPHADRAGRTSAVQLSLNGGGARRVRLRPGWNRIPVEPTVLRTLRVAIDEVSGSRFAEGGAGGLAELRVPGLPAREALRLPTRLARDLRGADLRASDVEVLLERTTSDFPYRSGQGAADPQRRRSTDAVDPEPGIERELILPARRSFELGGWASVSPGAPDSALDELAGVPRGWRLESSSRFEGVPGRRASSAFDGRPGSAWTGDLVPGRRAWVSLAAPRGLRVERLRLAPGGARYATAASVALTVDGRRTPPLAVGADGSVRLPRPLSGRRMRIEVLRTRPPRDRSHPLRAVAVSEISIPGVRVPRPRRTGSFATRCGELAARPAGRPTLLRVSGTIERLDQGRPLRLRGCGAPLELPAGESRLSIAPGPTMRADHVRLRSPAPLPRSAAALAPPRVLDQGSGTGGKREGVRLALAGPSWLVLGESYSKGWRAWCRGRDGGERELGAPVPVDGFANGWRVGSDCRQARFAFAPQGTATAAYLVSALACLAMLALLLVGALRRRGARPAAAPEAARFGPALPRDAPVRLPWRVALPVGAVVALLGGFTFALRAGIVLGPAAVLLVRWGLSVRRLTALAAAGLAALPLIYAAFPSENEGGYSFDYALDHLGAHWVAVGVVCCLAAAGVLAARAIRRDACESGSRSSTSPAPGAPGSGR